MDNKPKKTLWEKYQENPKKLIFQISLAAVLSVCIIITFYFCIARYEGLKIGLDALGMIIQPFVIGFCMAFLMNPIMKAIEKPINKLITKKWKDTKKKTRKQMTAMKASRIISSIFSLIILLAIIALCLLLIIPDTYKTVKDLSENLGDQFISMLDGFNKLTEYRFSAQVSEIKNSKFSELVRELIIWIVDYFNLGNFESISSIASGVFSVGRVIVNVIIGIFVSVYALIYKDVFRGQCKKIIYGIFKKNQANAIMDVARKTNDVFYGFIIGKIIDSAIIGVLCYIGCLILKMPYPLLVSVIVGITNVVPVFGPYFGAIPTVLLIFITSPIKGITFLIFIIVLQQIDGNFIGPKILGESTGISVIWVIIAIVIGGGLFGFMGMLLGVPTMAVIYYIFGKVFKKLVEKKNLSGNTKDYVELNHVDLETNEMINNDPVVEKQKSSISFVNKIKQKRSKKKAESKDIDEKLNEEINEDNESK